MITSFGVLSLVVLVICIVGMVLHYQMMLRRGRLDDLLRVLEETETLDETTTSKNERDLGYAIAAYNTYIARFPGVIMAKILGFVPYE